jgi:hypothetical protein
VEKGKKGNMESVKRKPFQGVSNIVRFNWHFYLLALALIITAVVSNSYLLFPFDVIVLVVAFSALAGIIISLAVSWYIYDHSNLYLLSFMDELNISSQSRLVTINAGFDETSAIIQSKYPKISLTVFDFYDPLKHTEVSIERARKAYPAFPGTKTISTDEIPLEKNSTDIVFLLLAAHEIRNEKERVDFFCQLKEKLKENGKIVVVEHQRDFNNFFAFNFGFFHFYSTASWKRIFSRSGLILQAEIKHTPFLSIFTLQKNGATA